jgi:hypothetical protein
MIALARMGPHPRRHLDEAIVLNEGLRRERVAVGADRGGCVAARPPLWNPCSQTARSRDRWLTQITTATVPLVRLAHDYGTARVRLPVGRVRGTGVHILGNPIQIQVVHP